MNENEIIIEALEFKLNIVSQHLRRIKKRKIDAKFPNTRAMHAVTIEQLRQKKEAISTVLEKYYKL